MSYWFAKLCRLAYDVVIHIRDVLDVVHVQVLVQEKAAERVVKHITEGMAEMGYVVRGDAADVHAYLVIPRDKRFFLLGLRIEKQHSAWPERSKRSVPPPTGLE